jgi:hypothetical protein
LRDRDRRNVVALELTGVLLVRSMRLAGAPNWRGPASLQFPGAEQLKQGERRSTRFAVEPSTGSATHR